MTAMGRVRKVRFPTAIPPRYLAAMTGISPPSPTPMRHSGPRKATHRFHKVTLHAGKATPEATLFPRKATLLPLKVTHFSHKVTLAPQGDTVALQDGVNRVNQCHLAARAPRACRAQRAAPVSPSRPS